MPRRSWVSRKAEEPVGREHITAPSVADLRGVYGAEGDSDLEEILGFAYHDCSPEGEARAECAALDAAIARVAQVDAARSSREASGAVKGEPIHPTATREATAD